jgi:VCBS repeat-containing protein
VNLGLANSLIVMLTAPLSNDTSRIINTLVSLRTSFWENFAFMEWGGLQNNFILDGIIQTDTEIDAILVTDAIAGMAALSTYPDSLTEHQLREENGLAAGQETIGKYILAEFAASTIDPPAIIPLQNATLRIYYTSLDLDRSLLRDGDITDIGDINEDTLSLYRWNSTGNTYELMSDGLPWVSDITLNTTNITVGDTDYEGYMDVTVSDDLGLFALGGIPNPDTTIAGAPAVVATTPMADADNVSVDAPIVVTFSEPVINENPDLIEMDGAVILSTSLAGNTLTIEHDDFVSGSSYLVTIPDSTVIDLAGNYNEEYSWTFTAVEPNNIPFANDDAFSCSENGSLSVNVFDDNGHGVDWDSEDDPLTITAVNNNDNNLDNPISGTGGGLFTLGADGDLIFETNSEFERIPDGMSLESSIIYTLGDGVGSDMATVTVTVSGVNNHPVLSSDERLLNPVFADAGNDNGTGADEDNDISDNYDNPGDFVADIIASTGTAVDTDNDALGMAVVGIDNRSGIWEYNLDNINWQSMNSLLSEYNSLLLPPGARIRFVPDPHINCTKASALSFKLWDQTSGTGGIEYWDSTTSNAFSINEALAVLQVNSVPWLPTEGDYDGDGIQNCEDSDPLQRGVLDTDNDGIDDEWEELYFDNLNQADGRSDFDGDGYSDLYEYLNWQNGTLDPDGYGFDPTLINAPGGEHYGEGLQSRSFWPMMMPAILSGAIN